jgi:hypothetical protein
MVPSSEQLARYLSSDEMHKEVTGALCPSCTMNDGFWEKEMIRKIKQKTIKKKNFLIACLAL